MKQLLLFVLLPISLSAQQPSHYFLGEEELEGIDIYSIHHATNGNYFLGTSSGLMIYNGYDFYSGQCPEALMTSVFNLIEDYQGNIYCSNLGGQIFKFGNSGCELFFTVPDRLASADVGIEIDNLNRLMVRAGNLLFLDEKATILEEIESGYSGFPTRMADSSIVIFSGKHNRFLTFKDGKMITDDKRFTNKDETVFNRFQFNDLDYWFSANDCIIYGTGESENIPMVDPFKLTSKKQSYRLYSSSNSVWLAPNSAGVYQFQGALELVNDQPYFPNTLISTVCEDREGNLLLGTFGKGIMVIPNERIRNVELPNTQEEIISIDAAQDGTLYFGTLSGKIYRRKNGETTLFRKGTAKRMEALFVLDDNQLLIGEYTGVLVNVQSGRELPLQVGAVKDAVAINKDKALVGSNMGCFLVNRKTGAAENIPELRLRHYCIGYNYNSGAIYAGSSKGLMIRSKKGALTAFELNGARVMARDIHFSRNRMYVATSDDGLLIFENDALKEVWNTANGLLSNRLSTVHVKDQNIVLATDKGMQVLDSQRTTSHLVRSSDGLETHRISDFEFLDNELWVVHGKGAQTIGLNQLEPFEFLPELSIKRLVVNDTIDADITRRYFSADQQKFSFNLSANNLRYQKEISYKFQLQGAENTWQTAPYKDHIVQYQSLSPGDYTFRAKAVCRDKESDEISYSFTIATPFYRAWWFYTLISVSLIILLLIWFRSRLKRQAMLAEQQNELNASKLTAIQSQMNPHFIFNALNSIQDLVLKGDVSNSYTYITKFADLVRRTLSYSDKDFIDFENELKLIELYLTLEKLRFKTNFEFSINAEGVEDIQIPPMLIQPFIENALVHGLLHREGEKKLDLRFQLKKNLVCTITDNGVGRERAKEIKERQRVNHESFSVNAIKRRFEILQRSFGGELGFSTEDLKEDGIPNGTRITLTIPVKRKF